MPNFCSNSNKTSAAGGLTSVAPEEVPLGCAPEEVPLGK